MFFYEQYIRSLHEDLLGIVFSWLDTFYTSLDAFCILNIVRLLSQVYRQISNSLRRLCLLYKTYGRSETKTA